jgi:glycosyltransferase involved in cell wall biosynthesis
MPEANIILLINIPINKAGMPATNDLIDILKNMNCNINIINNLDIEDETIPLIKMEIKYNNYFLDILYYQVKLIKYIIKNRFIEKYILFFGGELQIFPLTIIKIFNKESILILPGEAHKSTNSWILQKVIKLISFCSKTLARKIVIYSKNIEGDYNLYKFHNKLLIANHHFVKTTEFQLSTPYNKREKIIGFIGRLNEEKGIINLIFAFSMLKNTGYNFCIIGDGPLRDQLEILSNKLNVDVQFINWVEYCNLSIYLNKIKLLVLPSYTEGMPYVIIESMACGTPVLATPVGAIPDMITNNINGYLLTNNNPTEIAKRIDQIFEEGILDEVSRNSHRYVLEKYNINNSINQWNFIKSS